MTFATHITMPLDDQNRQPFPPFPALVSAAFFAEAKRSKSRESSALAAAPAQLLVRESTWALELVLIVLTKEVGRPTPTNENITETTCSPWSSSDRKLRLTPSSPNIF